MRFVLTLDTLEDRPLCDCAKIVDQSNLVSNLETELGTSISIGAKITPAYAVHGGVYCPFCGGTSHTVGPLQADGGIVRQPQKCKNCFYEWDDVYHLVDFERTN